uniref:Co-chaperonin GroES n=1 Tax=Cyanoptyche gloeocystis TaxID=77922 RepID=A0A3G1IWM7_9EUKA|nr:Co-chaperone GroES [Cyanoptyche gloeocystis]
MDSVDLNVSTLKPLGERVLVKMDKTEEKTTGGILLPDNAKKKPQIGEIIAIGNNKKNSEDSVTSISLQIGNKVLYSKYAGTNIKINNDEYILLNEKDILAIIE